MKNISIYKLIVGLLFLTFFLSQCGEQTDFYSNVLRSDIFYQIYDEEKLDFLWVFDNSGSMKPRRDFVKDNMQTFLNILTRRKAIDFQMAVTNTDMFSFGGDLVKSSSGLEVVKSSSSLNPVADFAAIINNIQDTPTSFWEQGLESTYQALYKHGKKFSREGVPLIIIILSDEDDYSCADNCLGCEPENNPNWIAFPTSRYFEFFMNYKKTEQSETYVFPIVGLGDGKCEVPSVGSRYIEVVEGIKLMDSDNPGVVGSICNDEIGESYENIARIMSDRGVVFKLSDIASGNGIKVYVDGTLVPYSEDNYYYEKETNSIVFTGAVPKKGSVIEVTYEKLTE